jgi:hypothetical protein
MIRPTRWGGCFNLLAMVAEFSVISTRRYDYLLEVRCAD